MLKIALVALGSTVAVVALQLVRARRNNRRLLNQLNHSLAERDAVFAALPDLLFELDREGRYRNVWAGNPGELADTQGRLIGRSVHEVLPPDAAATIMLAIAEALREGHSSGQQIQLETPDGLLWFELSTSVSRSDPDDQRVLMLSRNVTDRQATQERLQLLQFAMDHTSDATYLIDEKGLIRYVNLGAVRALGYSRDELQAMSGSVVDPSFAIREWPEQLGKLKTQGSITFESSLHRKDGSQVPVEITSNYLEFDGQKFALGLARDISERKLAAQRLELAASVFTHAREGIIICNANGTIIDVNDTFVRLTGFSKEQAIGQNPSILSSGQQDGSFYERMWKSVTEAGYWTGELWNRKASGEMYLESLTIVAVRDSANEVQHYVGFMTDVTDQRAYQNQLENLAHYDALTRLPNRVLLADRLHQAMAAAVRSGRPLLLAYIDLDGFKSINDIHGHNAGDLVLKAVSSRMSEALREGDTLARLGGDEFVAVLIDYADAQHSDASCERLIRAAAEPIDIGGIDVKVSASIGTTVYPQAQGISADRLLRQADQAMYLAKQAGKNQVHAFDPDADSATPGRHETLDSVRAALEAGQFLLHYQPQVNMATGALVGAEAMLRWQHPERGLLAPGDFMPAIENHELMTDVDNWVIQTALKQITQWKHSGLPIPVSVNISSYRLQHGDLHKDLGDWLSQSPDVAAGDLVLEIRESSALRDMTGTLQTIRDCTQLGVQFALDDFGTGYSSLSYVKNVPATTLKIDGSYIGEMLKKRESRAIVEGIISLASAFDRRVIAEGVESEDIGALLLKLGCNLAQGYAIAYPMPAESLQPWFAGWQPADQWAAAPASALRDRPALLSDVEHNDWLAKVEAYSTGLSANRPENQRADQCAFGHWIHDVARTQIAEHPAFADLVSLHEDLHAGAQLLLDLKDRNISATRTAESVEAIQSMKQRMVESLQVLIND